MSSLLCIFLAHGLVIQAAIFQCNFEIPCNDFDIDRNWGLTDGLHHQPIEFDHTLNTSSGHYLFFDHQNESHSQITEIKTKEWIQPSIDRAICFRMWYYTTKLNLPFNIQLLQGYDEQLTRIAVQIPGKNPLVKYWTSINLTLPNEQIKIAIRLNVSTGPLAFDDLSVDYCDEPHPPPSQVLFTCDFESSCKDNFLPLPYYSYQWSIIQANDAIKIEDEAPAIDYTFSNQTGHYAWLPDSRIIEKGSVGYLHLQTSFNITVAESYCLNFQYYGYGRSYMGNLKVYARIVGEYDMVQMLWPQRSYQQYFYTSNKWTWGIINLPVGYYSLLFYADTTDIIPHSFALDNIFITTCNYPVTQFNRHYSLLSFQCNFDDMTMCGMQNNYVDVNPTVNFTVFTGDTVPNRELGPTQDHTGNSSSGGFLYWNQQSPTFSNYGQLILPKEILQNVGMCIRFAYYVKSTAVDKKQTELTIKPKDCYYGTLWSQSLDDSQGWQVVTIPLQKVVCTVELYFTVSQAVAISAAVAFDDIEIVRCNSFSPSTTSTPTSTETSTTTTTDIITTSSTTQSTKPMTSTTITTYSTLTSTKSNAQRLLFFVGFNWAIPIFLLNVFLYV